MIGTTIARAHGNLLQILQSYYQLTKPQIIPLLLMVTAASMWVAGKGEVQPKLLFATLAGGIFAAASAQTLNCIYDRDIDYEMERTRHRPIPSGRVQPVHAFIFAIALSCVSFLVLSEFVNLLTAMLAMSGIAFYVGVYTHLLKRHTTLNIVIGGAAGAIPSLIGWAAVTGTLNSAAWWIFTIVFLWTPPHFWALALMLREDYAKVGIPMLPVVSGSVVTSRQIFAYTLVLVLVTFLICDPFQITGVVYVCGAFFLGAVFIQKAWALLENPDNQKLARNLFSYSILYLILLCLAMVVDSLSITHHITEIISHWASVNFSNF